MQIQKPIKTNPHINAYKLNTKNPIFFFPKPLTSKTWPMHPLFLIKSPNHAFNVMLRGLATTWKTYDFCAELYYKLKSLGLKANNFTHPFFVYSVWKCLGFASWKDRSSSGV